jgi:hypothetical protein
MIIRWIAVRLLFLSLCIVVLYVVDKTKVAPPGWAPFDLLFYVSTASIVMILLLADLFLQAKTITSTWQIDRLLEFFRQDAAFPKMDLKCQQRLYREFIARLPENPPSVSLD